jgi:3-hydroxyanthranilate 3,4-dioxygenase
MNKLTPINFMKWINEHRDLLKPPVGNKMVWEDREFIVMVVGGPNGRTDYHVNQGEEFFYQIEGDITLKVVEESELKDIEIKQGEIFLLPGGVPHSPQRPENTVGLVIERKRTEGELDGLQWYCKNCGHKVYEEFFPLKNIEKDFDAIFNNYFNNYKNYQCNKCGTLNN